MKQIWKWTFWLLGLLLLIFFIGYPIQKERQIWRSVALPLAGQTIVIDPGHGGPDGGAVGKDREKTEEKEIALKVAEYTRDYLQQAGAIVYMTREEDVDLADKELKGLSKRKSQDIRRRLQYIHEKGADFFISIHLNALPSNRWAGAQTFFYPRFPANKRLATVIQEEIIRNLENTNRVPLQMNHVYLLKHAEVPGALVEIGFLSNDAERELLKQQYYQEEMAASIYKGIIRYVSEKGEEEQEK